MQLNKFSLTSNCDKHLQYRVEENECPIILQNLLPESYCE